MKFIALTFCLISFSLSGQTKQIDSSQINTYVILAERSMKARDLLATLEKENYFDKDILDEKLALIYAQEIFKKQNSRIDFEKNKYSIAVEEDSSKKLWISMFYLEGWMDGFFIYVFVKNDGQLLFFSNHL